MKDSNYLSRIKLEFTKSRNKYRIGTRTTYKGRGIPMNIGKSKDNFDKDGKPRYFLDRELHTRLSTLYTNI